MATIASNKVLPAGGATTHDKAKHGLPLMMLGGSFFPFEAMPAWMAAAGRWTPNGLGVATLKELLYGNVSVTALGIGVLGIGIPATLAFVGAWRRLRSFANA